MIYVLYFCLALFIVILITLGFFKLKQPFWSRQPVFHLYNLFYWVNPPGIIQHDNISKKSRFFDPNIHHALSPKYTTAEQNEIVNFIQENFVTINTDGITYEPTNKNIFSYLNTNSTISLKYDDPEYKNKIIGCISGRPLICFLRGIKDIIHANYVDYLCIHKDERKKGVAPKLIYSYYHNQRETTGYKICVFKKENALTSIIPICTYYTYGFSLSNLKPSKIINVPKITNIKLLFDNIKLLKTKFECVIIPPVNDFIAINDIYMFGIHNLQQLYCLYLFRNTYSKIDGVEVVECFASINNTDIETFYQSFLGCIMQNFKDKILIIEDISDNNILIKSLIKHLNVEFKNPTGYYFYNYAVRPLLPNKVFIIN